MRLTNVSLTLYSIYCTMIIVINLCDIVNGQRTSLDSKYINQYRTFRSTLFKFIGRSDTTAIYNYHLKTHKVQKPFSKSIQFPCDPNGPGGRSAVVPDSVHTLRPGDIDVIGAIGDSLTAGNGAFATNILHVFIENKGVSWSIGGQGTWHKFLTLPNILKEFNPKLYGYSLSDGFSTDRSSRFNVAEIGAMSRDIPNEAKVLVKRMSNDAHVNVTTHWKLVTILIGPNDFCLDFCYQKNPERSVKKHKLDLLAALRILRDSLPRTMVNLVTPPTMRIIYTLRGKPAECETTHHLECPCIFGFKYGSMRERYFKIIEKWQQVVEDVAQMDEFHTNEFTVTNQPFLRKVQFPTKSNGNHDFTYMSVDCFHLSQKGYARASNGLWNNMFEPIGNKSINWKQEFSEFRCPTNENPYIYTRLNSR